MSKWKCEICGLEFENFHAQGFNHKIYCPLCYYKELYKKTELEREKLNNIIVNLDKMFEYYFLGNLKYDQDTVKTIYIKYVKLKELKENKDE